MNTWTYQFQSDDKKLGSILPIVHRDKIISPVFMVDTLTGAAVWERVEAYRFQHTPIWCTSEILVASSLGVNLVPLDKAAPPQQMGQYRFGHSLMLYPNPSTGKTSIDYGYFGLHKYDLGTGDLISGEHATRLAAQIQSLFQKKVKPARVWDHFCELEDSHVVDLHSGNQVSLTPPNDVHTVGTDNEIHLISDAGSLSIGTDEQLDFHFSEPIQNHFDIERQETPGHRGWKTNVHLPHLPNLQCISTSHDSTYMWLFVSVVSLMPDARELPKTMTAIRLSDGEVVYQREFVSAPLVVPFFHVFEGGVFLGFHSLDRKIYELRRLELEPDSPSTH